MKIAAMPRIFVLGLRRSAIQAYVNIIHLCKLFLATTEQLADVQRMSCPVSPASVFHLKQMSSGFRLE
jgi:hypothetical protein